MNEVVRESAWVCVKFVTGFIAGAVLTGCATPSGQSNLTAPGFYVSASAGAAQIDPDTINDTLEVDENITPSIQLGLGYQINRAVAFEVRAADLGAVEFTDGRELTYQVADATGLLIHRRGSASVFARLGLGTFRNEGDFDVELETPVHPVVGGGVAYHLLPNLDVRFSASAHGGDAVVGNAGLVWRFSAPPSNVPRIVNKPTVDNDGFEPIAPVARQDENTAPTITRLPPRVNDTERSDGGLVVDEKPIPTLQSYPEPVVPNNVAATVRDGSETPSTQAPSVTATPAPLPAPTPTQAPAPEPEPAVAPAPKPAIAPAPVPALDPVVVTENSSEDLTGEELIGEDLTGEDLFVVDTLLPIGPLQFGPGAATLESSSVSDVEEIIALMKENPTLRLQVESHAAPVGDADLNMLLSRRRALTVIRLLVEQGIEAIRLRPRAFGDTAPMANAETIDANDRVEFRIR